MTYYYIVRGDRGAKEAIDIATNFFTETALAELGWKIKITTAKIHDEYSVAFEGELVLKDQE